MRNLFAIVGGIGDISTGQAMTATALFGIRDGVGDCRLKGFM
jgi:hypothetical protein